tara:strand:+ start:10387 stop:11784 length:1398 start_codon:yes stop_codon:yes gene_type:complete
MPINFTDSPADGAIITQGSSTFTYNSTKGVWNRARILEGVESSGLITYATLSALPLVGVEDDTLVKVLDTNKLYKWTGTGWYFLDPVNTNPTITTVGDAAYTLATDGTPTVVTLAANDPEGFPIIWSYAVTAGSLGSTATVSQSNNVFTITPSTDVEDIGAFTLIFTASDGVNLATSASQFSLAFAATAFDYLVVGGGGGGGDRHGAGGGAGEYTAAEAESVVEGNVYNITIGSGGAKGSYGEGDDSLRAPVTSPSGTGGPGGHSTLSCAAQSLAITAYGGGGGGTYGVPISSSNPAQRGSGGGGGGSAYAGASGVGNGGFVSSGGTGSNPGGGGGGGAGGAGSNATNSSGGAGKQWLDGNYYAGGGGGGSQSSGTTTNVGGVGGGGNGGWGILGTESDGTPNTGSGAGGTRSGGGGVGGLGGTGVVILRTTESLPGATTTGTCVTSSAGGYTYYKFTSDGTITW